MTIEPFFCEELGSLISWFLMRMISCKALGRLEEARIRLGAYTKTSSAITSSDLLDVILLCDFII